MFSNPLMNWLSHIERAGNWFWYYRRNSPVVGRGSCEGSRRLLCWVVWSLVLDIVEVMGRLVGFGILF